MSWRNAIEEEAPNCRWCGNPLRRYMDSVTVPWDKDPSDVTNEEIRTPPKLVAESKRFAEGAHRANPAGSAMGFDNYHVSVFRGNYGYNGDGHFCSGKHAETWANWYLNMERDEKKEASDGQRTTRATGPG